MGELDAEGGRRTHELTDLLVDELELGVLWDEYGIIGDIMVSLFPLYSIRYLSSAFVGLSIFYYFTFIFSYPGWWTKIFFTGLFPSWPTFCLHLHTPPVKLASGPAMSHLKSPSSSL